MGMKNGNDMNNLHIVAIYAGEADNLQMDLESLIDWVSYGHAYEEYDSILVDGVEASDLV